MGLLNQIWWVTGLVIAMRMWVPGVENALAGNYLIAAVFLLIGLLALFLPEYIRWQLFGGDSVFERVPVIGTRTEQGIE